MPRKWMAVLFGCACLFGLLLSSGLQAQEAKAEKGKKAKKEKKENPRAVVERYEAKLKPVETLGFETIPRASVNWQRRANGEVSLDVMVRDLVVPERTEIDRVQVDLVVEGRPVTSFWIRDMRGHTKLESGGGDRIPPVAAGQTAELRRQGRVIMRGVFRKR
ncbi:MAG: hypothetical protein ACE5HP_02670 [Gemmatimonadota bacterium]